VRVTPDGVGHFHLKTGIELLQELDRQGLIPDFVFMDGPELPQTNMIDFCYMESKMRPGGVVALHDYDLGVRADGNRSVKCGILRPYITGNPRWRTMHYLTAPVSVGLIVIQRV